MYKIGIFSIFREIFSTMKIINYVSFGIRVELNTVFTLTALGLDVHLRSLMAHFERKLANYNYDDIVIRSVLSIVL